MKYYTKKNTLSFNCHPSSLDTRGISLVQIYVFPGKGKVKVNLHLDSKKIHHSTI